MARCLLRGVLIIQLVSCVTNEMSQDGKTVCTYGPLGHVTATNSRELNSYEQVNPRV